MRTVFLLFVTTEYLFHMYRLQCIDYSHFSYFGKEYEDRYSEKVSDTLLYDTLNMAVDG